MRKKNVPSAETELWVQLDKVTGEHIGEAKEIVVITQPVEYSNFFIAYISAFVQLFDKIGNQKTKLIKYILQDLNTSNNLLAKTVRELESETKISAKTITETLKMLEEANIITRKTGVIMLSPKWIQRNCSTERILMTKFR